MEFCFTDKRRFARVRLLKDVHSGISFLNEKCSSFFIITLLVLKQAYCLVQPQSVPPISELGPDALLELMPVDEFVESLSKKKIAIKAILLDQVI